MKNCCVHFPAGADPISGGQSLSVNVSVSVSVTAFVWLVFLLYLMKKKTKSRGVRAAGQRQRPLVIAANEMTANPAYASVDVI